MGKFYAGGLASFDVVLYPSSDSDATLVKPNAGPSEISATKGGPGVESGSTDTGFVLDSGYKSPMDEFRPGKVKEINLNDVNHDTGNVGSITDI